MYAYIQLFNNNNNNNNNYIFFITLVSDQYSASADTTSSGIRIGIGKGKIISEDLFSKCIVSTQVCYVQIEKVQDGHEPSVSSQDVL